MNTLKNVWLGLEVAQSSQSAIASLGDTIKDFLTKEHISTETSSPYHMTLGYFSEITQAAITEIFTGLYTMKEKYGNLQLVYPSMPYDHTLHKLDVWKSNVNDQVYIVLKPHNPDSIFSEFIGQDHISPHISLVKVFCDFDYIQKILPIIKRFRDESLKLAPITVDLRKIHVAF